MAFHPLSIKIHPLGCKAPNSQVPTQPPTCPSPSASTTGSALIFKHSQLSDTSGSLKMQISLPEMNVSLPLTPNLDAPTQGFVRSVLSLSLGLAGNILRSDFWPSTQKWLIILLAPLRPSFLPSFLFPSLPLWEVNVSLFFSLVQFSPQTEDPKQSETICVLCLLCWALSAQPTEEVSSAFLE